MNFLGLLLAIPKAAIFLLLVVGGALIFQFFYLNRKKTSKPEEVSLPPMPNSPVAQPPRLETVPVNGMNNSFIVQPTILSKPRLSQKTILGGLAILFVALSIPTAVILVRQRQEIRNQAAYPCEDDANCPGGQTCDYNACKPCSDFSGDESRCWTHGVSCSFVNGSCDPVPATPPPDGSITCTGGGVKNNTGSTISCTASFFSCTSGRSSEAECNSNPFCGGNASSENFQVGPYSSSRSYAGSPTINCGAWQWDYSINCGGVGCSGAANGCSWDAGCNENPTSPPSTGNPTPTPPTSSGQCLATEVFTSSWSAVSDFTTLSIGQAIFIGTRGSTTDASGITKARFQINGTADTTWCTGSGNSVVDGWCETTNIHAHPTLGTNVFYVEYSIPASGTFSAQAMVFNPNLDWQ